MKTEYILELTRDEANTLRAVLWSIGGSLEHSRRRHLHEIDHALDRAGVPVPFTHDLNGVLGFKEEA